MVGQNEKHKLRELSHLEQYHNAVIELGQLGKTAIYCRYIVPLHLAEAKHEEINKLVLGAIAKTVLDHPLLQVGITESAAKPTWVKLNTINLQEHATWSISATSDQALVSTNAISIDSKFDNRDVKPGWQVSINWAPDFKYMDIGFIWSHDIADGMGGKIIHEAILRHLNDADRTHVQGLLADDTLVLPEDADIPPAPEDVCKYPVTPTFMLSELWKEYSPGFLHPHRRMMANWAPIVHSPRKTVSQSISIDETTLQRVLSQSRANGTTLTGVLHGMTLLSLASRLSAEMAPGFVAETALDMRKLFKPQPNNQDFEASTTICNMVSSIEHRRSQKYVAGLRKKLPKLSMEKNLDTLLWSVAWLFRAEIAASLEMGNANKPNGLMKYVSDWKKQMESHAARQRLYSWSVSNLGVFRNGEYTASSGWAITEAGFRLSMEAAGSAIHVDAISVEDGGLSVMVNWQHGVVKDELVRGLVADIEHWFHVL